MYKLPKITYCVITYNEEKHIRDCLLSIFNQDYPKDLLEVIVVDDESTDTTLEIARQFPVKILRNGKKDADLSITIGFKEATGEFFGGFGADMQPRGRDWFKKMIKPLVENPDMAFAVTRFYSHPKESLITKYLNLDPLQRDVVYKTFSTDIEKVIVDERDGYFVCRFTEANVPPQSHGLYRVKIMRHIIERQKIWYDMGNLMLLIRNKHTNVGYVPSAGFYHFHADNLKQLLQKRIRNIQRSYLRYADKEGHFKWFNLKKKSDILKLIFLIVGSNLFLPIFLLSLYKAIKFRQRLYLLEAPITLALVDTILFTFLKEPRGLRFIWRSYFK